jgi:hypothetical protein
MPGALEQLGKMVWHGLFSGSVEKGITDIGKPGVAEGLDEAVGGNYLYHATGSNINDLKNIISNGLITNASNQERTGSKLRALSFTRNWRYALTTKDDDNQETTGIANGVIFVVDQSILKQKNKMQSVDRPADIINEFKAVLAALPTAESAMDLFQLIDGSVTPAQLAALSQIAGSSTPIMNGRQFISAVAKPYLADKTNQQALANAQSKIKQAISYFVKTSAGKSIASAGGSTASEYEEVILTPLNYVPFKDLGVVGYMINPEVDSANQQAIRNLFAKVGVNEMPIPNSTRPGTGVSEGAKVDRMVRHIKSSEKAAGKSAKDAESIAWATMNKHGYLDNKNKKKGVKEAGTPADIRAKNRAVVKKLKGKEVKEDITQEDIITKLKAKLGDYLSDLGQQIKKDPALQDKLSAKTPGDQVGPAVKTVTTDDGQTISIHGNEDDGFRISIKNKHTPSKFDSLDEAVMACEMYCSHRRRQALNSDYVDEA